MQHALDAFGPGRVMWGSDWPVCTLVAGYAQVLGLAGRFLAGLGEAERAAVMGGTVVALYGIDVSGASPVPDSGEIA